ncbi:Zn(2)-C6 fungal-type domain-containing protein [Mycena chlorophos]|uniref:Zn(2)-C6 fungal-type domain-containing protein n=1 Tax=Mycena chlorophos TaxID=658473 RepID=A0A8H6SUP7_MYCCL|nr:Zn(2)-C6 fungal-type domain-containing protein [Mycena chlorophos]
MAADLKRRFEEDGFVIVPGLVSESSFQPLKDACADVVGKTRDGTWLHRRVVGKQFPPYGDDNPDSWGVQHVMHPDLKQKAFAEWYTSDEVVGAVKTLLGCGEEVLQMELFNLLINPLGHDFALRWHRDDIPNDATSDEEQKGLDAWKPVGIQWNTALYTDSCLYVVPGSHKHPRTDEQRKHSSGMEAPKDPLDMPGAIQVTLQRKNHLFSSNSLSEFAPLAAGESVFYNSNILHCAAYSSATTRATLHATMGTVAGGPVRARNILQHGLSWMKEDEFKSTLRSTGRGKRSVLSEVPELTAIISEMGERIRQLEAAVAHTHDPGGQSSSHHPLLENALPPVPTPRSTSRPLPAEDGTLSVDQTTGDAKYFGPSAGMEALMSIEGVPRGHNNQRPSFTSITNVFPFARDGTASWAVPSSLAQLCTHLPPQPRAWALCERFFQNGCWTIMPIMQDEAIEVLARVYQPQHQSQAAGTSTSTTPPMSARQMAVVFLVLASGALVDLKLPPYSDEADHYFDLACAAMTLEPFYDNMSPLTVQMLALLAGYYAHGGRRFSMDGAFAVISLASNMAQRLGMHREAFAADMSPKMAYRCRALWWETYCTETIYAISVGRPTGTLLSEISCPYPPEEDNIAQPFCRFNRGYRTARWRWGKELIGPVMEAFLRFEKPTYEQILDLDQQIRRHIHDAPYDSFPIQAISPSPSSFIQKYLIPRFCKIALMYIHNSHFVEAMRANPANPLASPYAASYLAAYRSASEIIKADIRNFTTHPALFIRWWAVWKSLFNAAIIVGTVATRYPSSKLAPHAIVELFTAVDLIEKGAVSSGRAQAGLSILRRLRDKAIAMYSKFSGHSLSPPPTSDVETNAELDIFAGYTRVVAQKVIAHAAGGKKAGGEQAQPAPQQQQHLYPPVVNTGSPVASTSSPPSSGASTASSQPSPATQWDRLQLQLDPEFQADFAAALSTSTGQEVNLADLPWPQDFDPTIVQYFETVDPFSAAGVGGVGVGAGAGGTGGTASGLGLGVGFGPNTDVGYGGQQTPAFREELQQTHHPYPHAYDSLPQSQSQQGMRMIDVPISPSAPSPYDDAGFFFTFSPSMGLGDGDDQSLRLGSGSAGLGQQSDMHGGMEPSPFAYGASGPLQLGRQMQMQAELQWTRYLQSL